SARGIGSRAASASIDAGTCKVRRRCSRVSARDRAPAHAAAWANRRSFRCGRKIRLLLRDPIDVERDLDLVADQDATPLHGFVPLHAEVPAVHRGGGAESITHASPGILALSEELRLESDILGYSMHRERAGDLELPRRRLRDGLAHEGQVGELLGIEEPSAAE